jgi:hypothetical protein
MVANGIADPLTQDDPMNHIFMRYNWISIIYNWGAWSSGELLDTQVCRDGVLIQPVVGSSAVKSKLFAHKDIYL